MGCGQSGAGADGAEAVGPAAVRYFNLEGLPLSISAQPAEKTGLKLHVVGLDCRESLLQLEVAFERRGFIVQHGQLLSCGDLVDHRFTLHRLARNLSLKREYTPSTASKTQVNIRAVDAADVSTQVEGSEAAVGSARQLLRLTVTCIYRLGLRAAVAEVVRKNDYRIAAACFSTNGTGTSTLMKDDVWLHTRDGELERPDLQERLLKLRVAIHAALQVCIPPPPRATSSRRPEENTPPKCYSAATSKALVSAISEADSKDLLRNMRSLPPALQRALKDLRYPMLACEQGFQIPGYSKYVGVGLAQMTASLAKSEAPVLEIRTVFVGSTTEEPSPWREKARWLRSVMHFEKDYAEFVSWLDVQNRTWTIYKVFLHEALAPGQGFGAVATAEHLSGPPAMFFQAPGSTRPEQSGGDLWPAWLPTLMDSIRSLEVIQVCDVVNWNTYMLMAIAASSDRSADIFGEHMQWALNAELSRSKLSKATLVKGNLVEVFKATALGKLVVNVLLAWNKQLGLSLDVAGVDIKFSDEHEHIFGELRRQMDMFVQIVRLPPSKSTAATAAGGCEHSSKPTRAESKQAISDLASSTELSTTHLLANIKLDSGTLQSIFASMSSDAASPNGQALQLNLSGENVLESTDGAAGRRRRDSDSGWHIRWLSESVNAKAPSKAAADQEDTGTLCVVGLGIAISRLVRELQDERTLSCRAVAEAAELGRDGKSKPDLTTHALHKQRQQTDIALGWILNMLEKLWKPIGANTVRDVFRLGVESFQQVSVKVMMQRPQVEAAWSDPPGTWIERYLVCCGGELGYHSLVSVLTTWLMRAARSMSDSAQHGGANVGDELQLIAVLGEQFGRERAFLAAKGPSHIARDEGAQDALAKVLSGRSSLTEQMTPQGGAQAAEGQLPPVLSEFREMRDAMDRELQDPSFLLPSDQVVQWLARTKSTVMRISELQNELLLQLSLCPSVTSACLPTAVGGSAGGVAMPTPTQDPGPLEEAARALVAQLRGMEFTKVVALVGAGISVSANLPDFRSPGGLYDQLKTQGYTCPEAVFTTNFVEECPASFYQVIRQLRTEDVAPTPTHCFLKLLQDKGLLLRCYTQNIDALERKVGLAPERIVEAHGTMSEAKCLKCGRGHPIEDLWQTQGAQDFPRCRHCGSFLRPSIVFFGEPLPKRFTENAMADMKSADLVIVMGTSLSVHPFAGLIHQATCPRILVNRHVPSSLRERPWEALAKRLGSKPQRREAVLLGQCDERVTQLAQELGWASELSEVISKCRGQAAGGLMQV